MGELFPSPTHSRIIAVLLPDDTLLAVAGLDGRLRGTAVNGRIILLAHSRIITVQHSRIISVLLPEDALLVVAGLDGTRYETSAYR